MLFSTFDTCFKSSDMFKKIGVTLMFSCMLMSCEVVKEFEKMNINDTDMRLSADKIDRFETNFQSYREAASGANGGKTGGGCGCN